MDQPLHGITVLDLTRLLPGAVATQYLADHGAEVIKVEQPGSGDYAREMNPVLFAQTNAGKKSIVLDFKTIEGRKVLLALASDADVLIEGFRPGVLARLGLAYQDLSPLNTRLIYVSLTGYGQTGDLAGLAGHDINYIAMGGLLHLNLPVIPGVQFADLVGGSLQAVTSILLALYARQSSGRGQFIDISMTAGVRALLPVPVAELLATGRDPQPRAGLLSGRYACYNVYQASDDRWLAVGALEPKFWAALCGRLGRECWIPAQFDDARQTELKAELAAIFRTGTASAWFELLRDSDCCVTPVRSISEGAAAWPQRSDSRPVPALGEHTREILERLKSKGVIA